MTLRWGIVTAGKISHDFVNAFNTYPNIGDQVIAGVAARNKDKAAEFAKLHGIPKVFDDYLALAQSKDIGMFILICYCFFTPDIVTVIKFNNKILWQKKEADISK